MDSKLNFSEEDMKKTIAFLNMVAKHARFDLSTKELIEYFHNLQYMQKTLLPKIEKHIFEVKRVIEEKPQAEPADTESTPQE